MVTCISCHEDKPPEEFGDKRPGIRDSRCKACETARKARDEKNKALRDPDWVARRKRKTRATSMGLTLEQYEAARSEPCEICRVPAMEGAMNAPYARDGVFLGTLCNGCVSALGKLRHSVVLLERALRFLQR